MPKVYRSEPDMYPMTSRKHYGAASSSGARVSPLVPAAHLRRAPAVGIYGWRKRCVYAMVFLLFITVMVNVALTVWIIRVLRLSVVSVGRCSTDVTRGLDEFCVCSW